METNKFTLFLLAILFIQLSFCKAATPKHVELIYKTIDTVEIKSDTHYPDSIKEKSHPAIIFSHGGGWNTGNRQHLQPLATYYSEKGFVTFLADYRIREKHGFSNNPGIRIKMLAQIDTFLPLVSCLE